VFPGEEPSIVALHGFTQHGGMFEELAGFLSQGIEAPDLPGHGTSPGGSFLSAVESVGRMTRGRPLLGYSQGGRIALGVAVRYPRAISHLVLISANAGIENRSERQSRRSSDQMTARRIRDIGVEAFIDEWTAAPMFTGLQSRGRAWLDRDRTMRLENTAEGLAWAITGMGQGAQPFYGKSLECLTMPILVIVGGDDPSYLERGEWIVESTPNSTLAVVERAGHALVGEAPDHVASEVTRFLIGSSAGERRE